MSQAMSFQALTPTAFLERAGSVFADKTAVIDGDVRFTYAELLARTQRLAGALQALGVGRGDRVAVLAPNTYPLLEAHYGVPMAGAVLVTLNTRLTPADVGYILEHASARVLIYDHELRETAAAALTLLPEKIHAIQAGGEDRYEALLEAASPRREPLEDERALLAINYTSGTTGKPKGVMYCHRGAYLQALAMAFHGQMNSDTVYLWTLPLFHCNGWCMSWGVTAAGGAHLCLRKVDPPLIWQHLLQSGVTHAACAPTVLGMIAWHPGAAPLPHRVRIATGGAPPSPALLTRMGDLGIDVTHLYGLTETYGPSVICEWRSAWNALTIPEQAQIKARQGVGNVISQRVRVVDEKGQDVPRDATTIGEIALRGNNVMLGYYRDEEATRKAAPDGWFRTGDLGVMHPDGYVELRDRSKDIIISGGENIASVEVENALVSHPAVLEAAVVAALDEKWGEVPVAFVSLKPGATLSEKDLIDYARGRLARFKVPKRIVFGELPKTATGKIQKFALRERLKNPAATGGRPP